jgi:hypothetical protein
LVRFVLVALSVLGSGPAWAAPDSDAFGQPEPAPDPAAETTAAPPAPVDTAGETATSIASPAQPAPQGESARSPIVAGLLSFALPIAAISVLPVIDPYEFEARGSAKTAWHVAGWSAIGLFAMSPTLGALYAGDPWSTGTKVRVASAALFGIGTVLVVTEPNPSGASFSFTRREAAGTIMGAIGALGYLTGMVVEGVHSVQVAGRPRRPARASVSAGALQGRSDLVPAMIVSGAW